MQLSRFRIFSCALFRALVFTRRDSCEIVAATRARERGCYHLGYKHLIFRGVDSYPSGKAGAPPRAAVPSCYLRHVAGTLRAAREPRVVDPAPRAVDPDAPIRRKEGSLPSCKRKYTVRDHGRDKALCVHSRALFRLRHLRERYVSHLRTVMTRRETVAP